MHEHADYRALIVNQNLPFAETLNEKKAQLFNKIAQESAPSEQDAWTRRLKPEFAETLKWKEDKIAEEEAAAKNCTSLDSRACMVEYNFVAA